MFASILCTIVMSSSVSHLGPIPMPQGRPRVGPGRVEGKAVAPEISPIRGNARWIWLEGNHDSVRFHKHLACEQRPDKATIRVSADCSYRLYVNGQIVSRGPADIGRDYDTGPTGPWFYDVVDVARWLREGSNSVAVEVVARPLVQSEGTWGKPGLWLEADFGGQSFGSDDSWRACANKELSFAKAASGEPLYERGTFLTLSGDAETGKWRVGQGVDWKRAEVSKDADRPLVQSEILPPMEAVYPATGFVRVHGGVSIAGSRAKVSAPGGFGVRFDRVLSAHIVVRVQGGEGAVLTLMPNERNAEGFHRAVRLKLGKGAQTFEVPFFDSFSVINVEATGVTSPIVIDEVRAVFRSYPVEYRGSFECSDPALNEIWKVGRWSTQICMQTHHLDSPHHQEPISDPGDYLIESLINYNTFGEAGLARQDLRKYAQIIRNRKGRVFHTSYALLWLQMLVEYWQHTGDRALLEELAPTAFELIDVWETWRVPNGLISQPPNFMFIDWVEIEGFNLHHPPAVIGQGTLTAFYYRALEDAAGIAESLGNAARSKRCHELRQGVREAFTRELWSPEKRLYRDGKPGECKSPLGTWLPADKDIETFSSQLNILACANGLARAEEAPKVLGQIMESGPAKCQPYFMHFAFEALERTGLYDAWGTRQLRRWKVFPEMQSFFEMWDSGDLSHAWQCTPTYQLSARVLGVSPMAPGFKKVRIQPRPCDLTYAKGTVPTPHGPVTVSWERKGSEFLMKGKVPNGSKATLVLPDSSTHEVGAGSYSVRCLLD